MQLTSELRYIEKHFQKVFYPYTALMYPLLSWYINNQDTVSFLSTALIELHTFHSILTWILKKLQFYFIASFMIQFKKKKASRNTDQYSWIRKAQCKELIALDKI